MKYIFILLFILSFNSLAVIRYVSKTGSSTAPYTSWAAAGDSIQKVMNISVAGDTIYVGSGEYIEHVVFRPGIALIGSGMDSCRIRRIVPQSANRYEVVDIAENCILMNFHIINESPIATGIIYSQYKNNQDLMIRPNLLATLKIENNKITCTNSCIMLRNSDDSVIIRKNVLIGEDGIYLDYIVGSIENNLILFTGYGITPNHPYPTTIRNNIVYSKTSWAEAFSGHNGFPVLLANNIILLPNCIKTGLFFNTNIKAVNNLIKGNEFEEAIWATEKDKIINNHIEGGYAGVDITFVGIGDTIIRYNNFYRSETSCSSNEIDSTNTRNNPMFVNSSDSLNGSDFHLQKYSPLIDAGDPAILDMDGTRSDIGVYGGPYGEAYTYNDLAPVPPKGITAAKDSLGVKIIWDRNSEADFKQYYLYRDTVADFTPKTTNLAAVLTDTVYTHSVTHYPVTYYYKLKSEDNQGNISIAGNEVGIIISSIEEEGTLVVNYKLYPNYPNPFNPGTVIPYQLKERGYVKLYIYDIKGEEVALLVNEEKEAGYHEAVFNTANREINDLASGIYLYRIEVTGNSQVPVYNEMRKMILVK